MKDKKIQVEKVGKIPGSARELTLNDEFVNEIKEHLETVPELVGPRGRRGEGGEPGRRGRRGLKGETGEAGEAGDHGVDGAEGPHGPKGGTGKTGLSGRQGETGAQGPKGPKGDKGEPGEKGKQGRVGPGGARGGRGAAAKETWQSIELQGTELVFVKNTSGPLGAETRVDLSSLAAASFAGLGAWRYRTETSAPPNSGQIRFDNSDPELATEFYVHDVNADSEDLGNFLGLLDTGDALYIQQENDASNFITIELGTVTDSGTYFTYGINNIVQQGAAISQNTRVKLVATIAGQDDHGVLTGLGDDDHPQYRDGSIAWTGNIDVGSNDIVNVGLVDTVNVSALAAAFVAHAADGSIHFTVASIDHTAISNIGTNSHAAIDTHIADGSIHFTEASIAHGNISGIGTNSHAAIDTHIADGSIHFADAPADASNYVRNNNAWVAIPAGAVVNNAVQARRTTDLLLTTAFVDVSLDTTDEETDAGVLNHDLAGNTDNIIIGVTGVYKIHYGVFVDPTVTDNRNAQLNGRVRVNDGGTGLPGSVNTTGYFNDSSIDGETVGNRLDITFYASLTAADFITLQLSKTEISGSDDDNATEIVFTAERVA